jgi:hypothetical protein
MLDTTLGAICNALNQYFRNRFGIAKDKVKLSNVVVKDDSAGLSDMDKISVTLIGLHQESNIRQKTPNLSDTPIHLTMYVLFSVYFGEDSSYDQSLKELSAILSFFQGNPVITSQNAPDLPSEVERLTFKLENQALNEQQNMWSMLGGKHVPSVVYRVNIVPIMEGNTSISGRIGVGF